MEATRIGYCVAYQKTRRVVARWGSVAALQRAGWRQRPDCYRVYVPIDGAMSYGRRVPIDGLSRSAGDWLAAMNRCGHERSPRLRQILKGILTPRNEKAEEISRRLDFFHNCGCSAIARYRLKVYPK